VGEQTPEQPGTRGAADDPLPEATVLARRAASAGLGLKLLGGLAVRVLCPGFPPRLRAGQDIDFACLSKRRKDVAAHLEQQGCVPDRRFNNLNGDRQMYFNAPSGRPIDLMVDRLTMCHTLDLRPSFGRLPLTVDAVDVLLSKLQIVELNEKDARDILHLLGGVPVGRDSGVAAGGGAPGGGLAAGGGAPGGGLADSGGAPGGGTMAAREDTAFIDTERFSKLLGSDWGWWRTVTGSLGKLPALAAGQPGLLPPDPPYDPLAQAARLLELAESAPKGVKWRIRANIGDRVRWYELPEEVGH
jgi:hypothetical protein